MHPLFSHFLCNAGWLRPFEDCKSPTVLSLVVLEGIKSLESASGKFLTQETALLLALTSLKRVGDLQTISVAFSCLEMVKAILHPLPDLCLIRLWSRKGYTYCAWLEALKACDHHSGQWFKSYHFLSTLVARVGDSWSPSSATFHSIIEAITYNYCITCQMSRMPSIFL